ncbi:class I SAM-dependent methyltransferase [Methanobacterium sp. MBAC-LM]|uniref:class I SAM-dependent methyltransferase n=1 Tax=Methanobacterium sp. MBAC-LM TaxID=3412034 RepID=UPI003C71E236
MNKKITNICRQIIKNFNHHKIGRCNICGKITIFLLTTNIEQARGDFICIYCRSYSRKRHVAKIINELISDTSYISQIPDKIDKIHLYNLDVDDAFYNVLYGMDSFVCSDFLPDTELGTEIKKGVFCQDIEKLTFPNESFDLVITEDVFEHVRNYENGFNEILRVLKKGGYHIFTIPFNFDKNTIKMVKTSGNKDIPILPPEYHESKSGKVLTYRTFGLNLYKFLDSIGFKTQVDFSGYSDHKYRIYDSFVFISKKM